jgi:hypothetical protein
VKNRFGNVTKSSFIRTIILIGIMTKLYRLGYRRIEFVAWQRKKILIFTGHLNGIRDPPRQLFNGCWGLLFSGVEAAGV